MTIMTMTVSKPVCFGIACVRSNRVVPPELVAAVTAAAKQAELVADENFADRRLHRAHFGVVGIVFMVGRQRADFIRGSFRIGA
jgi:hypothetical protein